MSAARVFFEGQVQGVGFRYAVKQIACGYDVAGWVRNLPDGRVELHLEGEPEEVSAFLAAIQQSELASHIRSHARQPATAERPRGFAILPTPSTPSTL